MDYDAKRLDAYNKIKEKGSSVHIRRKLNPTFDPITESTSGSTLASFSTYAVIFDYNEYFIDDTLVLEGDKKGLVPAYSLGTVLEAGDILCENKQRWEIIDTQPVAPDANEIIYEPQLRRVND